MGKASRRRTTRSESPRTAPVPFAARPFEGLPGETEWVAMREILPAATAPVTFTADGQTRQVTVVTVLPLAWPALHRAGGELLLATQSGVTSGDPSRDLAAALLLAAESDEGTPVTQVPAPTAESPRLQDLLDGSAPLEATVHETFDFWLGEDAELDDEGRASLDRANESVIPTVRVEGSPSVYWCLINGRSYVRWVLPYDEDTSTAALARLHAAERDGLGEESRLLGAFRAAGLLVPVWEVPVDVPSDGFGPAATALWPAIEEAAAETRPLDAQERRARAGLVNRQVTLR